MHQNVCSIRNKVEKLEVFLLSSEVKFNVLCLTEHFLCNDEVDLLRVAGYYAASSYSRQERTHGGAILLTKIGISCCERVDIVNLSVEGCCKVAAAEVKKLNLVIVVVYRPLKVIMLYF
mgnify:CR=1 FL=1